MSVHPLAGQPAPPSILDDVPRLVADYYTRRPDPRLPGQSVSFGTSGHRGSSGTSSFNERHILAVTQAICDTRRRVGVDGPLFLGVDTHALSEAARRSAVEVLAANAVDVLLAHDLGPTPTPVVSHAILAYNEGRSTGLADGIVITPSHNPPRDGGFKYNPPHGGPAGTDTTRVVEERANALLAADLEGVRRIPWERALAAPTTRRHDFVTPYVADLGSALELAAVSAAGVRIGVDPLGGAALRYWEVIADLYSLDLEVVNPRLDPTFAFMPVDRDGVIRMDCSSPWAMHGLIELADRFDVAFGNDPDADRHGIVTRSVGLLNPNHYLCVAIDYLCRHRPHWPVDGAIGKTLVSSSLIDRVAESVGRRLAEVPVGFKWFVEGLLDGTLVFGGEESAGATFLRGNGSAWTTDKDGLLLGLLAAEITAVTGRDPGERYEAIAEELGRPIYERIDAPADRAQKARLASLDPDTVAVATLAGEPILATLTRAPANDAPIGGLKVVARNGWFAARPSGTEDVYKIYAESFLGPEHLAEIQAQAREVVGQALAASP